MADPSALERHIAHVAADLGFCNDDDTDLAAALLADPTLAAIYDLAALFPQTMAGRVFEIPPEVRALLADWRDTVEEREFAKRVELND